ncbi:MAG TPA: CBS domain-containing protein [Planctomycetota bacterium]|nr:CBS domain-containing protein [Planctomycetota bacterium]
MKVSELMTESPATLEASGNLAQAAEIFWTRRCGVVPIVDGRRLVGVLTDRDVAIALGTRNRRASEVRADEVMTKAPVTCGPDEEIDKALALMHTRRVRRLLVTGRDGTVRGILSIGDLIRTSQPQAAPSHASVLNVLKRFYEEETAELTTARS